MRRRDLLGGILAAAATAPALAVATPENFSELSGRPMRIDSGLLIVDARFDSARRFAEAFRGPWTTRTFHGDITPLWREVMAAQWPWRPGMQWRGMTTPTALLCL